MNNIEEELPEDEDQSAIINKDVEFENRSVDPGFVFEETQKDINDADDQLKGIEPAGEQGTERGAPGLGELDGTNPGSNHHPMDS